MAGLQDEKEKCAWHNLGGDRGGPVAGWLHYRYTQEYGHQPV
jgi:hypothetical protein